MNVAGHNWDLAEQMLYLRVAQMEVNTLIEAREFKVPIHLALGHEAIAVALANSRQEHDPYLLTHRNVHYNLAIGCSLSSLLFECALDARGAARGTLGMMNLATPSTWGIYTSSILGNNLPVAVGVALAEKLRGSGNVVWVTTGDGAIEEGAWYESLLIASSLSLSIVFLVEDNRWSLATEVSERRSEIDESAFVTAVGAGFQRVVGNRLDLCRATLTEARSAALGGQPQVVICELTTLGSKWVPVGDGSDAMRLINYHAGLANSATRTADPIVGDESTDPLSVAFPTGISEGTLNEVRGFIEGEVSCYTSSR